MRDIEFIPAWYPQLRRRKRALVVQAIASGAIVLALTGVTIAKRWDVQRQQAIATDSAAETARCSPALARLSALQAQQRQLRQQVQVIAQLGEQLDPTRLINLLEDAMPSAVQLTDLSMETPSSDERALAIRMQGIAPDDAAVATLLTNLGGVKFFDDVTMSYSRDHAGGATASREFELTFKVGVQASALQKQGLRRTSDTGVGGLSK